ncbi:MAG TPA: c-type cytochrome [Solirubrobacterales bacterium]|jgi:ubiquinol-cytochrome c reductase cytochrome c subunit
MSRHRARTAIGAGVIAAALVAVAARAQPPSGIVHGGGSSKPLLEAGSELYAANCASCHGIAGRGVPFPEKHGVGNIEEQGPPLIGVGALAPDFYLRTGRMPLAHAGEEPERQRPFFSDHEIRALVAYVARLGRGPAIPHPRPATGRVPEGYSLFSEHCAGCHQIVGEGGYVTGAKVPVLEHATPRQIAEAVRIGPFVMPSFSKAHISDDELDKIIAYVLASRDPEDRGGLGIGHIGPVPEGIVAWLVAAVVLVGVCALIGERVRS